MRRRHAITVAGAGCLVLAGCGAAEPTEEPSAPEAYEVQLAIRNAPAEPGSPCGPKPGVEACYELVCADGEWQPRPQPAGSPCHSGTSPGRCQTEDERMVCRPNDRCPDGSLRCGGACPDLANDPANCGGCGNACPAGATCSQGRCIPAFCAASEICTNSPINSECVCRSGTTCRRRCGPPICEPPNWFLCVFLGILPYCFERCEPGLCSVDTYCLPPV